MASNKREYATFKVTARQKAVIKIAAEAEDVRVSEFLRRAAEARVREVLARASADAEPVAGS